VKAIVQGLLANVEENEPMQLNLLNVSWLAASSLYARKSSKTVEVMLAKPDTEDLNIEVMETEMRMRIEHQLGPEKIRAYLDDSCHRDGSSTPAEELVCTMEDFVRILYATAYAEGREKSFPYRVSWGTRMIKKERFEFKEHYFLPVSTEHRKRPPRARSPIHDTE
jgi:hypothetical protein